MTALGHTVVTRGVERVIILRIQYNKQEHTETHQIRHMITTNLEFWPNNNNLGVT